MLLKWSEAFDPGRGPRMRQPFGSLHVGALEVDAILSRGFHDVHASRQVDDAIDSDQGRGPVR